MKKMKKLFKEQLQYIDSKEEATLVYDVLVRLNKKLDRHDSRLENAINVVDEFLSIGSKSKMKAVIRDIFDHYDEYNASEKAAINGALAEIQSIAHSVIHSKIIYHNKE